MKTKSINRIVQSRTPASSLVNWPRRVAVSIVGAAILSTVGIAAASSLGAGNGFSQTLSQYPPGKATVLQQMLDGAQNPYTNSPAAASSAKQSAQGLRASTGPVKSVATLPSGIFGSPQPPFPAGWFVANNMWTGQANGVWWWVFAGQVGVDQSAAGDGGLVLLEASVSATVDGPSQQLGPYLVGSSSTGGLKVASVSGNILNLVNSSGGSCQFDLATTAYLAGGSC